MSIKLQNEVADLKKLIEEMQVLVAKETQDIVEAVIEETFSRLSEAGVIKKEAKKSGGSTSTTK